MSKLTDVRHSARDVDAVAMSRGVVETWLETLGLDCYSQSFIDNGYDDLDVCRQIGDADLDAIGVTSLGDRAGLLAAVGQLQPIDVINGFYSCHVLKVFKVFSRPY